MFKKRIMPLFVALLMIFAVGCGADNGQNKGEEAKVIVDSYGREVEISENIDTVVSIAPSITETIYALGAGEMLVGRTDFCDYPEEVSSVESIGSLMEPSIEKIVEIDPDIVIASTHFQKEALDRLEEAGLTVLVLYGEESFEGVYEVTTTLGHILNKKEEAESLVDEMKAKVDFVKSSVEGLEPVDVYYVVSYGEGGDYTATGETFISNMIEMAGGNNIASDAEGWKYSLEKLVESDPEIIICSQYFDTKEGIQSANGYAELTAVKEGRLYEVDNNKLDRQGARLADGLEELARTIHPDAFN